MKILITNDDGIKAPGIRVLAQIASNYGEVYVVAPHTNNSAVSHGITMRRPLKSYPDIIDGAILTLGLDGTPTDCVKYSLAHLKIEPDLVLSGINDERNIGTDVLYSGTVSAAIEANLCGYPAIAISTTDSNMEVVEKYFPTIFEKLLSQPLMTDTTININFPSVEVPKGVKVATVGISRYDEIYIEDQEGHRLSGPFLDIDQSEETDVKSIMNGYITITPLKFKLYDEKKIIELSRLF
ncbi:MAG: 5'/3'-nucleotidase SurE [Turicibacter sp.]|nr:5'/3'-nucleotidase SurE [Turicibacter sp.]